MIRKNEVDVFEALELLGDDVSQEVLGRLAEQGIIRSRLAADGNVYFLREDIEKVVDRQIAEARRAAADETIAEGAHE